VLSLLCLTAHHGYYPNSNLGPCKHFSGVTVGYHPVSRYALIICSHFLLYYWVCILYKYYGAI
jgi:hypothetical protein